MINPEIFRIGPLSVRWYAVIILTGAILATWLSNRVAQRKNFPDEFINDLLFYLFPIGIVGARIYYVAFTWDEYKNNLWDVFKIWEGGIAIYGGLIAGLLVIYWYAKKKHTHPLVVLDIIVPYVLLAQGIGRWGNFMNQEAFGAAVSRQYLEAQFIPSFIIDRMYIGGTYYQPTFLYESVLSVIGCIVLIVLREKWQHLKIGDLTLGYIFWYGIERFIVEGMRSDSLYIGAIRVSQALSVVLVIFAIIAFFVKKKWIQQSFATYMYSPTRRD
ncbi:prolipoprotein diacylglyceryl transferase [Carnobacteriaceae bacterium zg-ZUI252]|nr:prolipoprotein diacylglyceryl transferase [Carnobacteriaceae bacterium zg-ZUI252]MBS4769816.1 prolipoprotein diacylglyceryl transferase [Carnobacteriaceae bacterium zg-ZUI240]QTU82668.1 prolipoprotein diacylglyceryl transferase [Carnobacteriaceae bacterium zg-C25]